MIGLQYVDCFTVRMVCDMVFAIFSEPSTVGVEIEFD